MCWVKHIMSPIVLDCRRVVHSDVDGNPQPNTQLWSGNCLPLSNTFLQAFASSRAALVLLSQVIDSIFDSERYSFRMSTGSTAFS